MIYLSRKLHFSAAHVYWVDEWTEEENQRVFGLCSNRHGHGHDYVLEIMVRGELDPKSGIVVNITDIDRVAKGLIESELDGKFLDREHPYFQEHMPTTENIVRYLWEALDGKFPDCELYQLILRENHYLHAEKGRDSMVRLTRKYHFSAAHRLHSYLLSDEENKRIFGKCNNPNGHGHNYYLEVTVQGEPDSVTGMVMNLADLDHIVDEVVIKKFDHKHLNLDTEEFKDLNPTSDVVVKVICEMLAPRIPKLFKVGLWETEKNYFEYYA
ncbi:6-carboxytetrahydropterin synthase [Paenibacillus vulneris]|uniref:6-carboxy-5,6,7,8-tetrahydropterin synthase n=1 Tax=Paenibacillus vulneris TaxID=1133364 RepID=A0ABW3USL9_9BACL|nr:MULTISPECIES: 6-carboxytetrahydropterin synthase [unclassified Paenibacillus]MBE1446638.1 6-pyruvoyltetrahydropterin/6-carboxytetrahydropterin synthase [Paenibacillus sp. OAS669]